MRFLGLLLTVGCAARQQQVFVERPMDDGGQIGHEGSDDCRLASGEVPWDPAEVPEGFSRVPADVLAEVTGAFAGTTEPEDGGDGTPMTLDVEAGTGAVFADYTNCPDVVYVPLTVELDAGDLLAGAFPAELAISDTFAVWWTEQRDLADVPGDMLPPFDPADYADVDLVIRAEVEGAVTGEFRWTGCTAETDDSASVCTPPSPWGTFSATTP